MPRWQRLADELATTRYPALLGYAMAFTGQRATAEDLVQEALVRTFGRPRRLHDARHAEHYVRRVIASLFIDDRRRDALFARTASRLADADAVPDTAAAIDARDEVARALMDLTPQQRACVILRYYDDLTIAQVADRLGVAAGTVKRHLHDATARLRGSLGIIITQDEESGDAVTISVVDHFRRGA